MSTKQRNPHQHLHQQHAHNQHHHHQQQFVGGTPGNAAVASSSTNFLISNPLEENMGRSLAEELHRTYISKFGHYPYIIVDDLNGQYKPIHKIFKPQANWAGNKLPVAEQIEQLGMFFPRVALEPDSSLSSNYNSRSSQQEKENDKEYVIEGDDDEDEKEDDEEGDEDEDDDAEKKHQQQKQKQQAGEEKLHQILTKPKQIVLSELKTAGYCECCKSKYEVYSDHVASAVHVAFARNASNFKEIDGVSFELEKAYRQRFPSTIPVAAVAADPTTRRTTSTSNTAAAAFIPPSSSPSPIFAKTTTEVSQTQSQQQQQQHNNGNHHNHRQSINTKIELKPSGIATNPSDPTTPRSRSTTTPAVSINVPPSPTLPLSSSTTSKKAAASSSTTIVPPDVGSPFKSIDFQAPPASGFTKPKTPVAYHANENLSKKFSVSKQTVPFSLNESPKKKKQQQQEEEDEEEERQKENIFKKDEEEEEEEEVYEDEEENYAPKKISTKPSDELKRQALERRKQIRATKNKGSIKATPKRRTGHRKASSSASSSSINHVSPHATSSQQKTPLKENNTSSSATSSSSSPSPKHASAFVKVRTPLQSIKNDHSEHQKGKKKTTTPIKKTTTKSTRKYLDEEVEEDDDDDDENYEEIENEEDEEDEDDDDVEHESYSISYTYNKKKKATPKKKVTNRKKSVVTTPRKTLTTRDLKTAPSPLAQLNSEKEQQQQQQKTPPSSASKKERSLSKKEFYETKKIWAVPKLSEEDIAKGITTRRQGAAAKKK